MKQRRKLVANPTNIARKTTSWATPGQAKYIASDFHGAGLSLKLINIWCMVCIHNAISGPVVAEQSQIITNLADVHSNGICTVVKQLKDFLPLLHFS